MIILRLTGEGEVFYSQIRVGKDGKLFGLLKFATMLKNSPNLGTGDFTVGNDPRILPLGTFLRNTKINELPQILNIIKGDMSLVGPRPLTEKIFNLYSDNIQKVVIKSKPGLTGIGSLIFRNEERLLQNAKDQISFYKNYISPYKGKLENWYYENKSLKLYFKIIFITAWIVIFSKSKVVRIVFKDLPLPPKEFGDF